MDADLERALATAGEVVFLCSGNIIRSAFAELYLRHLLGQQSEAPSLPVRSAGTTYHNHALYVTTRRALEARGVSADDLDPFRPTHLSDLQPPLDAAAVIFGMTREHLDALGPHTPGRAFLLPRLLGDDDEIDDPMFTGGFEGAFQRIARCVETLAGELATGSN